MQENVQKDLANAVEMMKSLGEDPSVPRNIRSTVLDAADKILQQKDDLNVRIGSAMYSMEDISNDINMPSHTRTEIWTIISALEAVKEKLNKK